MKGHVDKDICIGCGLCTSLSPEVFQMDDDGTASASKDEILEELMESAEEAKESCPVAAITLDEK